jgi:outer membrane protein
MKNLLLVLCLILTANSPVFAAQTNKSSVPAKKPPVEIKLAQSNLNFSQIGIIDINKILMSYVKYQDLQSNQKISAADIQEYTATAEKEINSAKSQDDKRKITEKHLKEIEKKKEAFKTLYGKQMEDLRYDINLSIKTVAQNKKLHAVFKNDSLFYGGVDITDAVIAEINKK